MLACKSQWDRSSLWQLKKFQNCREAESKFKPLTLHGFFLLFSLVGSIVLCFCFVLFYLLYIALCFVFFLSVRIRQIFFFPAFILCCLCVLCRAQIVKGYLRAPLPYWAQAQVLDLSQECLNCYRVPGRQVPQLSESHRLLQTGHQSHCIQRY